MGAGVIEANRTGGSVKRIHCGWAAHGGVARRAMAREGVTGPPTVLEGRFGFFNAFIDGEWDEAALLDGLGERWELLRTVYKPYPSNHFTHPGIDAALALRAAGLDVSSIVSVELGVSDKPFRTIGEPREEKIHPQTPYHAKFSGPYTVASALLGGGGLGVYLDDFTQDAVHRPGAHRARREGPGRRRRARHRDLPRGVRRRRARAARRRHRARGASRQLARLRGVPALARRAPHEVPPQRVPACPAVRTRSAGASPTSCRTTT